MTNNVFTPAHNIFAPSLPQREVAKLPSTPTPLHSTEPLVLDALIYQSELAKWLGKAPVTMWRWVKDGYLPKPGRMGNELVWTADAIREWAQKNGITFSLVSGTRHTCK